MITGTLERSVQCEGRQGERYDGRWRRSENSAGGFISVLPCEEDRVLSFLESVTEDDASASCGSEEVVQYVHM
jgi:hypothetical protein